MGALTNFSVTGDAISGAPLTTEYDQISARLFQTGKVQGFVGYFGTRDGKGFNGFLSAASGVVNADGSFAVNLTYQGEESDGTMSIAQADFEGSADGLVKTQGVVIKDLHGNIIENVADGPVTGFQIKVQAYNAANQPVPLSSLAAA